MAERKQRRAKQEPVFIVKPALKHGGLDYLHISLIALAIVLIALAFSLAYFKPATLLENCQYGIVNGTCTTPKYNSTQALAAAGRVLASYSYINTSLSLLPYYSEMKMASATFVPSQNAWLIDVPYIDPLANNQVFNISMVLSGSNLSLVRSYIQSVSPTQRTNDSVVAFGTVQLYGRFLCTTKEPIPVYAVIDPYAPGAFSGIAKAINLTDEYHGRLNVSYDFVFTNYSTEWYAGYGTYQTQLLGMYLFCSSQQGGISGYANNVSKVFEGRPLSNQTLYQIAVGSGLDMASMNACLANSTTTLSYQAQLARFYNIQFTPQFIIDCRYSTIPETAGSAVNYTLSQVNQSG